MYIYLYIYIYTFICIYISDGTVVCCNVGVVTDLRCVWQWCTYAHTQIRTETPLRHCSLRVWVRTFLVRCSMFLVCHYALLQCAAFVVC